MVDYITYRMREKKQQEDGGQVLASDSRVSEFEFIFFAILSVLLTLIVAFEKWILFQKYQFDYETSNDNMIANNTIIDNNQNMTTINHNNNSNNNGNNSNNSSSNNNISNLRSSDINKSYYKRDRIGMQLQRSQEDDMLIAVPFVSLRGDQTGTATATTDDQDVWNDYSHLYLENIDDDDNNKDDDKYDDVLPLQQKITSATTTVTSEDGLYVEELRRSLTELEDNLQKLLNFMRKFRDEAILDIDRSVDILNVSLLKQCNCSSGIDIEKIGNSNDT